jgi:hypothetical protein
VVGHRSGHRRTRKRERLSPVPISRSMPSRSRFARMLLGGAFLGVVPFQIAEFDVQFVHRWPIGEGAMPIHRLLRALAFDPEQVRELVEAYEGVLAELSLVDRTDPVTELIAKTIIDCAKAGEFDRKKLHDCALAAIKSK